MGVWTVRREPSHGARHAPKKRIVAVTPGVRTSEFILALVIVALCVAVVNGKVQSGYTCCSWR